MVEPQEVSCDMGFFGIIFGSIGIMFVDVGFKGFWFDPLDPQWHVNLFNTGAGSFREKMGGMYGFRSSEGCADIGTWEFTGAVG